MSELGETFRAWREEKQDKRQSNLESSTALLRAQKIEFKQLSEHHLRVGNYDFWPLTGKFMKVGAKCGGRGVINLLIALNRSKKGEHGARTNL